MKKTLYGAVCVVLFFSVAPFAFATITVNPGAPTTPQPSFGFFCSPYNNAFVSGDYYEPLPSNNTCTYELPAQQMASSSIFFAVYKGTPGNATLENVDYGTSPGVSIIETLGNDWTGSQGDNFFAVAMGYDDFNGVVNENTFLTTGGTDPGNPYSIVQWIWGAHPTSPLTVTTDNQSILYGSALPTLTATLSGFVSGTSNDVTGTPSCSTTATATSSAGTYPITCTQGTLASTNYTFNTFVPGTLTITKANQTITFGALTDKTFGIVGFTVDAQASSNLGVTFSAQGPCNVSADIGTANVYVTGAGTCTITAHQGGSINFNAAPDVSQSFTIHGAPLTVSASNQTMEAGSPLPALTATITGFVSGQTLATSDVTGSASCTTTATSQSPVGTYPITCAQGTLASTNYTFSTFVAGILSVVDTTAPSVSIVSPAQGATYLQNAIVPVTVSINDFSAIATSTYTLDGKLMSPANPLPLSSTATGTATFVVSATDKYGNTGYATSTFTIQPVIVDATPPTITITSPQQNGLYAKSDTVYLTANVTDQSPIATTTYWFNNKKINPANPLPLSTVSTPSIQSVSVSATDTYGNTATSTLKFFVVKSTNSCLQDIITVLTLIIQDKTLPNKPTILQLISDCSALLKDQHRGY